MPRLKGSGKFGPVRSLRLPRDLDAWFEQRLRDEVHRCASDILLQAVHGGLRLRPGYMRRQRATLEELARERDFNAYEKYVRAIEDTFGRAYVAHMEAWLVAEDIEPLRSPDRAVR